MTNFTSISPRQLHEAARGLLEHYAVERPRLTLLRRERNVVFRVNAADGNRYVLRITPADRFSDAAARVQLEWMKSIASLRDFRGTTKPLRTRSRLSFLKILLGGEEVRNVLLSWTPGRRAGGRAFLTPANLKMIGRKTATLHNHSAKFRNDQLHACPQWNVERFFGKDTCVGPRGR